MTTLAIKPLLQQVLDKMADLTAGLTYITQAGGAAPLATSLYRLPNAALDTNGPGPFPYLVARPLLLAEGARFGQTKVRIFIGLYNPGEGSEGEDDLESLAALIFQLAVDQDFTPYSLDADITIKMGGADDGGQPHPEYYLTADLAFTREAISTTE